MFPTPDFWTFICSLPGRSSPPPTLHPRPPLQSHRATQLSALVEQLYAQHADEARQWRERVTEAERRADEAATTHDADLIALRTLRDSLAAVASMSSSASSSSFSGPSGSAGSSGSDRDLVSRLESLTHRVAAAEADCLRHERRRTALERDLAASRAQQQRAELGALSRFCGIGW